MRNVTMLLIGATALMFPLTLRADSHYAAQSGQTPSGNHTDWSSAASNIQEAVDAASADDTVWVGPGHYTAPAGATVYDGPNVVYVDKPLILRSSNSVPDDVIIDGEGANRGICVNYPHPDTPHLWVIDGFTVSNCVATNRGGGIMVGMFNSKASTGIVQNCRVVWNTVKWGNRSYGGGIYIGKGGSGGGCTPIVSNCVVEANEALYGPASGNKSYGGGIYLRDGPSYVGYSTVFSNTATIGGGLQMAYAGSVVENTSFTGNMAAPGAAGPISDPEGAGMALGNATTLRNCLVTDNASRYGAGAILMTSSATHELDNCTVVNNRDGGSSTGHGSVFLKGNGTLIGRNVIVVSNSLNVASANQRSIRAQSGGAVYLTNSCVIPDPANVGTWSSTAPINESPALVGFEPHTNAVTDWHSLFDISTQDYRLSRVSPCIDAGTNLTWMGGAVDLDGYPRITGSKPDVGSYEYVRRGTIVTIH